MREMSGVICGPRGVSAGSSAGFNLNKWPRQRNQLKFRERGEQRGRRRIKLHGSGVCSANSPTKPLPYQLGGLKTSRVGGRDRAGAVELGQEILGAAGARVPGTKQTLGMRGAFPESLSGSFALISVSRRGGIAGKNKKTTRITTLPLSDSSASRAFIAG